MKKQLSSLLLALVLLLSLTPAAGAYDIKTAASSPIAMSLSHAAYLDDSGALWTWGRGASGELGSGARDNSSVPVKVMDGVTAVSIANGVSAAIKSDKSLWMWGSNYHGQLGTKGSGDVNIGGGNNFDHASKHYVHITPVKVMDDVASVQAGSFYTAAIKTDGSLWMWGDNQYGHIGNNGESDKTDRYGYVYQTEPVKIMDSVSYATFNEDAHTVAAIQTDGSLWMWGKNIHSELGNNGQGDKFYEIEELDSVEYYQTTPIKALEHVTSVSLGANHTAAIQTDGSLWMWGSNYYGQLGNGTNTDAGEPVKIRAGGAAVDLGWSRTAVLKTDGSLWTWGRNCYGQLGSGSTEDSNVPVPVKTGVPGQDAAKGNDTPFSDVSRDAYYYEPVLWAVEKQITNGVTATQFSPGATCTRGEIITFLWRAMGQPEPEGSASPFADVAESDFYYKPVLWAYEQGMAAGANFSPKSPCTRSEAVSFLWHSAGRPEASSVTGFADVGSSASYAQAVSWAVSNNIVNGTSDVAFSPSDTCTRGQIVALLWRYLGK